jgi:hypothetical protein
LALQVEDVIDLEATSVACLCGVDPGKVDSVETGDISVTTTGPSGSGIGSVIPITEIKGTNVGCIVVDDLRRVGPNVFKLEGLWA